MIVHMTQGLKRGLLTPLRLLAALAITSSFAVAPLVFNQNRTAAAATVLRAHKPVPIKLRSKPTSSDELITDSASRKTCIYFGGDLQPGLAKVEAETGTSPSCITAFLNGAPTWSQWDSPWITKAEHGYTTWVAARPKSRQLILQVDLIPDSLENRDNPLAWEQSCATGQFDSYAQALGTNLVAAGLQNSVIRLGAEMNGPWEADFMGTTTQEQNLWATCFANEVTALRQVDGEHFLFDWNPNACYENVPYLNYYPGNSYVDIIGIDLYNGLCSAPTGSTTPSSWSQLANEPAGLSDLEAFAKMQVKAISFPEWGLLQNANGDDPNYVNGIDSTFRSQDCSFESYFDAGDNGTLQIGPTTPQSLAAYQKWFGST
jgi:hypothetical protein